MGYHEKSGYHQHFPKLFNPFLMDLNMFPLGETVHQRLERLERQV